MNKFYVKVNNVYFGRAWFVDRFGHECEGQLCFTVSKLLATSYTSVEQIQNDMERLSVDLENIELEKSS